MFRNLSCGALGVGADLAQSIEYAKLGGFQGVDVPLGEVEAYGLEGFKAAYAESGMQMGGVGLPVDWMGTDEAWQASLQALPAACELAQAVGATRYATWVPSWSDERDMATNIEFHVTRFRPIAEIMRDYGIRLGLEFIGPKTLRNGHAHEFVYDLQGMLDLCDRIGTGNVGLLLDCWHWYTSGGTTEDLGLLSNENVVYVHVNDAPLGVPVEEQLDNVRDVPGATGVIDITAFLQALEYCGYDGPVTPEPFCARLKDLTPEENITYVGRMLQQCWEQAGL